MKNQAIINRNAVRAIVLTPSNEVLMMRIVLPKENDQENVVPPFWICPGGGLEDGESDVSALRRELREEIGLLNFELGPLVWKRQHTFNFNGKRLCQSERYYITKVTQNFEPLITDEKEAEVVHSFKWWNISDLRLASERITPLSLVEILDNYLATGSPKQNLETEILED